MKVRIIETKANAFGKRIIKLHAYLSDKNIKSISDQVLRSGTSIGANVAEGTYAQSTPDYISKHSIALKEANETKHWIEILQEGNYIDQRGYQSLIYDLTEIIKILTSILKTSKGLRKQD